MTTKVDPLDFGDVTLRMDSLDTAAIRSAGHLIAWCVENWSLADDEGLGKMPRARNVTLCDSGPYLVRFFLGGHTEVLRAIEVLAVLSDSQRAQKSCNAKLEHLIA